MVDAQIRFGILGCANIARKLCRAISLAPNATLYAIASRSLQKAEQFASENNLSETLKLYGNYQDLLEDPLVDAVYLPLPTSLHVKWATKAAEKKKHVLLEKPTAANVYELDLILESCESNGVQFMDGTMWMHHPRTEKMRELLSDANLFGDLKLVHSTFTLGVGPDFYKTNIRVKPELEVLGALGDLGWYCIRSILWAADYELPETVAAFQSASFNEEGGLLSCGAHFLWANGKEATFHCGFMPSLTMELSLLGTKGTLNLNDFVIPFQENSACFSFLSKPKFTELNIGVAPLSSLHRLEIDLPQEVEMIVEFSRLVRQIKDGSEPSKRWCTISRKTQLVMDAVKSSIDKEFQPVKIAD